MDAWTALGEGKYLLVTTFKRDGTPVPTPVWVAPDGPDLVFWTVRDSWKVKRLRHTPRVEVGPCDLRGTPLGESRPATARLLDDPESERVRRLIQRKYGILGWLTVGGSRLRRGTKGTVGVALTPAS
ncbi:PPOX class probable F420-dependent enzyme [Actinokineospora baliensis]|uniref:PPOX class F420-dependent oxidoreductase n=1 Tax=Actinokineospora baliensis TaxID=547056 RepID=UPI00195B3C1C|nr:PPOX class F420-dependent oxidoreductase [Actinokineospora baliensis]MBM7775721.1 PPOX class probable F420-dependent enzyme [Actinokineospora baliensis]